MWHDMTWYKPQQFSGNLPVQATVRTELCPLTSLYYLYISIQKNTLEKKLLLPRSFLKIFKQVPICSNCLLLRRTWTSWAVFSFLHVSTIDPASWPWWSHRWCQWTNLDQRAFVAKLKQKQSMTQNSEIQELWPSLTHRKKEHTYKTNMYQYVPTCTNIYQWYTSSIGVYAPTAMYFLSQIQALHIDFNTGVSDFKPFKMQGMRFWCDCEILQCHGLGWMARGLCVFTFLTVKPSLPGICIRYPHISQNQMTLVLHSLCSIKLLLCGSDTLCSALTSQILALCRFPLSSISCTFYIILPKCFRSEALSWSHPCRCTGANVTLEPVNLGYVHREKMHKIHIDLGYSWAYRDAKVGGLSVLRKFLSRQQVSSWRTNSWEAKPSSNLSRR